MKELIDKAVVVAEIEGYISNYKDIVAKTDRNDSTWVNSVSMIDAKIGVLQHLLSFLNTLEVKEVNTWHLQEKENIYDAVKDWGLYTFVCIMKDGTIQKFNGCLDEDCEGHINAHIDGVNDGYDNVDDIVKWIEII